MPRYAVSAEFGSMLNFGLEGSSRLLQLLFVSCLAATPQGRRRRARVSNACHLHAGQEVNVALAVAWACGCLSFATVPRAAGILVPDGCKLLLRRRLIAHAVFDGLGQIQARCFVVCSGRLAQAFDVEIGQTVGNPNSGLDARERQTVTSRTDRLC